MNDAIHDVPRLLNRLTSVLRIQVESDPELLRRFTTGHDEDAFAELVHRHGALVLGVCRRVLRDSHAAEDAFQATFLLLAGRAARLEGEGSLAGWLYGAAWRTARQARRANERRRRRERQASRSPAIADDLAWREVREILDAELMRLPEHYRTALVLCYIEGLTQSEAARQLGCDAGVLRGRLERGRAQLRRRLEKHGLSEALVLLPKGESVPAALQSATVRVALVTGTLATGMARWHLAVGLLLLLIVGLGASAASLLRGTPPSPPPSKARLAAPPAPAEQRMDRLGDPLPDDALLRLGTLRYRYLDHSGRGQHLRDGRTLLFTTRKGDVFWIDGDTGRTRSSWVLPQGLFAAGFSSDGRLAVLHDGKRSLQLWDLRTRQKVRTFEDREELSSDVSAVFSPDGRIVLTTIAINGIPGLLQAWDVTTGRQLWCEGKRGSPGGLRIAGFLPDSRVVVLVGHRDARVSLRDLATGKQTRSFATLPRNSSFISRLAPDGKTLLYATHTPTVRSWDLTTGKERPALLGHLEPARMIALAGDGRTLVTGGDDPFVLVWDWPEGKLRRRIDLRSRRTVTHLHLSADGKWVEVGLWPEKAARFFDLATGKEQPVYPEAHTSQVQGLAVTSDGKVISGGNDDTLRMWDLGTGRQLRAQPTGLRLGAMSMSLSGDGRLVATADINEGQVRVFALPSCRLVRAIDTGGKSVRGAHFCGTEPLLLIDVDEVRAGGGNSRRFLSLWDVQRGREVRRLKLVPVDWQDRAVSSDGRLLAGGNQERLSVWGMASDREWRTLPVKTPNPVAFAPDGRTLACSEWERFAVWELGSATARWQIERSPSSDYVTALRFSPDGRWLAVGRGPRVELRDALSGQLIHVFAGHAQNTLSLAFSPDGKRLVSSSFDTTMLVWDLAGVVARQRRPDAPTDAALTAAWTDLGSGDSSRVCRAMALLIDFPGRSVPLLRKLLRPAKAVDVKKIARSVVDLDSDELATRERASRELKKAAEQAEEALRRLLNGKSSPEARRRAERLLRQLAAPFAEEDRLREMRALEVLDRIGTAEAARVLETLASGARGAWQTREAAAGAQRLRGRR